MAASFRSSMKMRKSNGPRTGPWGAPLSMDDHADDCPFRTVRCFLSVNQLVIQARTSPSIPRARNFFISLAGLVRLLDYLVTHSHQKIIQINLTRPNVEVEKIEILIKVIFNTLI